MRFRLLASILVVTAAGMGVAGGAAYAIQRERTLTAIDARLSDVAEDASLVSTGPEPPTPAEALAALAQHIRPSKTESTFTVLNGRITAPAAVSPLQPVRDPQFVDRVITETRAEGIVRGTAETGGTTVRYEAIPVTMPGVPGSGIFVVTVDLNAELKPINDGFGTFAGIALLSLLALLLVGWLVVGRLLRPIRRLRETAARITASDVSERIEVTGGDDVSELTVTVNGMLDRLERALTLQQQLLDDVGHELKTPITIVRGHLELMDAENPADVAATRDIAVEELDRVTGLVREISDLASIHRPLPLQLEPTDIESLTDSVRLKASGLSSAHKWTTPAIAQVVTMADSNRLTQAWLQMAANAVTHAGPPGEIQIESERVDGHIYLRVRDYGVGIDPEVLPTIFDRLHRGTDGRGASGSGLGLTIVSAIATAHGGTARAESVPGRGSTFTIELPLQEVP